MAIGTNDRLAHIVLDRGLCTEEQVRDALRALAVVQAVGAKAQLAEVLLEKGYVTLAQMRELRDSLARDGARRTIGGYELLDRVGQGGMGSVYRARQRSLNRVVALKLLPKSLARDRSFIRRFQREARLAARLDHPNLVQVYDIDEDRGQHFIAMEFVQGVSVSEVIGRNGRVDEGRAIQIACDVSRALAAAEAGGIVHRDIKPANIMISDAGHTKLADMGLAKDVEGDDVSLTRTGTSLGTPEYMSPEQATGKRHLDVRSDIYSLGATLYHMVTGRPPFEAKSSFEMLRKHVDDPPTPPREVQPEVSKPLEAIILKCLAKKPGDRFQSPGDLRLALEGLTHDSGTPGPELDGSARAQGAPTTPERIPPDLGGWLVRLGGVMLLFALLGGGGAFALRLARRDSDIAGVGSQAEGLSARPVAHVPVGMHQRVHAECVRAWGSPGKGLGQFNEPSGIAVAEDGRVYVTDRWNHRVQVFTRTGEPVASWPDGARQGRLFAPGAVSVIPGGGVVVADTGQGRAVRLSAVGRMLKMLGRGGSAAGELLLPSGVAASAKGVLVVTDRGANRVRVGRVTGGLARDDGLPPELGHGWRSPRGAAIGPGGEVVVADAGNGRIVGFTPGVHGSVWHLTFGPQACPTDVAPGPKRVLFVTDARDHRVYVVKDRALFAAWGEPGHGEGLLCRPEGIATGLAGEVYVADTGNNRVQVFRVSLGLHPGPHARTP